MEYQEKYLFRKRNYKIEDSGVTVEDNGVFKSTRRFFTYDTIGNEINYTRDEIASKILLILGLLGSSIYLSLKYELLGYVLAFAFVSISFSMVINIIKQTAYIGTISFRNSSHINNDTELYLKADIPFSEKTKTFIDSLRKANIEYSFKRLLKSSYHRQAIQQIYINQLNGLRDRLKLNETEYNSLYERLKTFFNNENIKESYGEEE